MRKLDPFSPEKKAILDFFIRMVTFLAVILLSHFISHLVMGNGEPYNWRHSLIFGFCFLLLSTTIAYFISRLLCYHTKFLPKIENRQGLQVVIWLLLTILFIIATLFFM